jgi:hypothetical protein
MYSREERWDGMDFIDLAHGREHTYVHTYIHTTVFSVASHIIGRLTA